VPQSSAAFVAVTQRAFRACVDEPFDPAEAFTSEFLDTEIKMTAQ
jgi:hypothetical protein